MCFQLVKICLQSHERLNSFAKIKADTNLEKPNNKFTFRNYAPSMIGENYEKFVFLKLTHKL